MKNTTNPTKVIINDVSNYKSDTCNNGGNYSFCTIYTKIDENNYEVTYGTSSEFPYCPFCGSFYDGNDCACGMDTPDVVSYQDVEEDINNSIKLGGYEVKITA